MATNLEFQDLDFEILDFKKDGVYDPDDQVVQVEYIYRPLTRSAGVAAQQFTNIILNDRIFYIKSSAATSLVTTRDGDQVTDRDGNEIGVRDPLDPVIDAIFKDINDIRYVLTFVEPRLNGKYHLIICRPI